MKYDNQEMSISEQVVEDTEPLPSDPPVVESEDESLAPATPTGIDSDPAAVTLPGASVGVSSGGVKTIKCGRCSKVFASVTCLKRHVKNFHSPDHLCELCNKGLDHLIKS